MFIHLCRIELKDKIFTPFFGRAKLYGQILEPHIIQYLVGPPLASITAWIRLGMDSTNL
jgi:hypothetical protein